MSKFIKNHIIAELERELEGCSELLVVDMSKMSGTDANNFRVQLGQKDISLLTVKNSLARRACENLGIQGLDPSLSGSSTLVGIQCFATGRAGSHHSPHRDWRHKLRRSSDRSLDQLR